LGTPRRCGTGNLSNNVQSLTVDSQGRLCIYRGGNVITGDASGTTAPRRAKKPSSVAFELLNPLPLPALWSLASGAAGGAVSEGFNQR
jgi:hypothetical protein